MRRGRTPVVSADCQEGSMTLACPATGCRGGHSGRSENVASNESLHREVLPIPDRKPAGLTTYDAKDPSTNFPPIRELRPPAGAPNVLIVLLDDVGFGASSAFGGPCQTPTAERLASNGLKYTRFHTTAL